MKSSDYCGKQSRNPELISDTYPLRTYLTISFDDIFPFDSSFHFEYSSIIFLYELFRFNIGYYRTIVLISYNLIIC